jgi:hypothetical protein
MYNLHQLGWYNFQLLASTIAKEVFGQTSESFLPSKDGGRDGAFSGTWNKLKNESVEGEFVFQCKFTSKINYNLKESDLDEELQKIKKLVRKGQCDNYLIFTNAGVSGVTAERIKAKLIKLGVNQVLIYDNTWIIQTIKENKKLRMLVPRIYGLGDLSQILDERVYAQGKELLETLRDELAKVVITSSYRKAAEALEKHGFVLLIGEPAAGKTTIASLLALTALDQWETPTMKLETADQVITHWNNYEKEQFIWIDDAFGVTQHESSLTQRWNHAMPQVKSMLKKGVKIVMTSRDYIYEEARKALKTISFPLLNESQVVIDVHKLTLEEKRQILYNHLKMGDQPTHFRKEIKPYLDDVAPLKEFLPETARRLGSKFLTKGLLITKWHVLGFIKDQKVFFVELLENLSKNHIAGLALIYMNNDLLDSPLELNTKEIKALERLDSTKGGCSTALSSMKGNLVQFVTIKDRSFWKFKHPTIGDAFSEHIANSPELIEIYLHGCEIEKLLSQTTCGNVGIKNAVIIQKKFYPLILTRLVSFTSSKNYKSAFGKAWGAQRTLLTFLATKCSDEFLKLYAKNNPDIFEIVSSPGQYVEISPEVELAYKLNKIRMLPEAFRVKFVERIFSYAKDAINLYALKLPKVKALLTEQELLSLREIVTNELIPILDKHRENRENNFAESENPEDHMSSFVEMLDIIEEEYNNDYNVTALVRREKEIISNWVDTRESTDEMPEREKLFEDSEVSKVQSKRSIFDDIDE